MDPFLGQIVMFGGTFAPRGWALCQGQLLPVAQNTALYSLLGTYYGGDGRTTFGLPDLRGRSPRGVGSGPGLSYVGEGYKGGSEEHTLSVAEMPSHDHPHTHSLNVTITESTHRGGKGRVLAKTLDGINIYALPDSNQMVSLANEAIGTATSANAGGGQSFPVLNPYLGINYIIALEGVFPQRS